VKYRCTVNGNNQIGALKTLGPLTQDHCFDENYQGEGGEFMRMQCNIALVNALENVFRSNTITVCYVEQIHKLVTKCGAGAGGGSNET